MKNRTSAPIKTMAPQPPTVASVQPSAPYKPNYFNKSYTQNISDNGVPGGGGLGVGNNCCDALYADDEPETEQDIESFEQFALISRINFKLFMSELIATFAFVYLGQSALTSFELIGTQNDMLVRQLATLLCYGLALMFATQLTQTNSGVHLNPAYTFASAVFGQLSWGRAFSYFTAQYLGAFVAAIFQHATYSDKLAQRHAEGLLMGLNTSLRAHGNILSTGKLFSSFPPTEVSLIQLTVSYTLATAHLVLLIATIRDSKHLWIARNIRPFYLAGALCLVLGAFSANGGPVWNPAQDFSPRLYIALSGWGSAAFSLYNYKYWWLCGLVAPHAGALIGFGFHQLVDGLRDVDLVVAEAAKGDSKPPLATRRRGQRRNRKQISDREYSLASENDF